MGNRFFIIFHFGNNEDCTQIASIKVWHPSSTQDKNAEIKSNSLLAIIDDNKDYTYPNKADTSLFFAT